MYVHYILEKIGKLFIRTFQLIEIAFGDATTSEAHVYEWFYCFNP
jgi:hypothetical protein